MGAADLITIADLCNVKGKRYASLLYNQIIPILQQRVYSDRSIFMQDDALPHIAMPMIQLLKRHFGNDEVRSCYFPTAWSSNFPDFFPVISGCGDILKMLCSVTRLQI